MNQPPYTPRGFPELAAGQFAVVQADPKTGTLLDAQGNWALAGAHYYVFSSEREAQTFVEARLAAAPYTEWVVLDHKAMTVSRIVGDPVNPKE